LKRDWELENTIGSLMVSQNHSNRLYEKLHNELKGASTNKFDHYIKLYNKWYRMSVNIEQVDAPQEEDRTSNTYGNLIGQILVSDYQVFTLRNRLADMSYPMSYSEPKSSSFDFKCKTKWYGVKVSSTEGDTSNEDSPPPPLLPDGDYEGYVFL
jgi:hypothetical protein